MTDIVKQPETLVDLDRSFDEAVSVKDFNALREESEALQAQIGQAIADLREGESGLPIEMIKKLEESWRERQPWYDKIERAADDMISLFFPKGFTPSL